MEFIPGEPEQRPAKIKACAARTEAVREAERELSLHSLVGVLLDARVRITCEQVRRDVLRQLRIPDHLLAVSKLREATFLLQFERPELRNAALGRGMLSTGLTKLHFLPWTRQYAVTSASKLHYRHPLMLSSLTLRETEDEKACLCVWVWIADPDSIAIGGVLSLEEPMEYIEEQHIEFSTRPGSIELPVVQNGPAGLLDYEVLLHVDRVVDYTPPPPSPSWKSYESDVSGIPDDSPEDEWPIKHRFN